MLLKQLSALISVGIGFLAGKLAHVKTESIAALLFYFVAPIVFFAIPTTTKIDMNALSIIGIVYILAAILSALSYWLCGKLWQDSHRNILAFSAGTGNSGFVVLPIAAMLFDDHTFSIYAFSIIGTVIYESSIGCYYCIRSTSSLKQSLLSIVKLPLLNAFGLGCILSLLGVHIPHFLNELIANFRSVYVILGMVTIGLALAEIKQMYFDGKFTAAALVSKFVFYPAVFNMFILLDMYVLHWFDNNYYNALRLLAIAPIATNTIVFASLYKIHPEKVATAVLISLILALIYIPLMVILCLHGITIKE